MSRFTRLTCSRNCWCRCSAKLGNLVVDGGIWMNTQRPEWNDANNALVGQGLSMVTLCYLRRYLNFLDELLRDEQGSTVTSAEVASWLADTATALARLRPALGNGEVSPGERFASLGELGEAASRYRDTVYGNEGFSSRVELPVDDVKKMLGDALAAVDHSLATNRRDDGMFHAYNLLDHDNNEIRLGRLYPMLEGQVAALSTGSIAPTDAIAVLEALFDSRVYRPDQHSFMLYPDRELPSFLEKNVISQARAESIPLLGRLLESGDRRIVVKDADGALRFNANFVNAGGLDARLDELAADYGKEAVDAARAPLENLYEEVFNHQAFTGRSGGMFGFEGLGCIYWHMVAKLLLAVQENFFLALQSGADAAEVRQLGELYYRVRHGIGFNKSPTEFGAFPTDPYSHTPGHAGAQQPGMTGQVKEEVLTRFGELGVRVADGQLRFVPGLLRPQEFLSSPEAFRYLDVDNEWQEIDVAEHGLAFSWCQVPVVFSLSAGDQAELRTTLSDGTSRSYDVLELPGEHSAEIFRRSGLVRRMDVQIPRNRLFN